MTTATNRRRINERFTRATMFCLLAFAAVLCQSREAAAQWVTNGNNINNTNSGRVGIGTADASHGNTVNSKFTIASQDDVTTAFATSNGIVPRFALNHRSNGSWTLHDYAGNKWNQGITQMSGNVGIGAATPGSKMVISANAANPLAANPADVLAPQDGTILHIVNADSQKTRVTIDSFGNSAGPSVSFRAGRGTLAAPTATLAGDALGIVYGGGFGVSRFHNAAKPAMWMVATENWTDTSAGSAIFFNTVQNGSTATIERMRISNDGNVGIGTTTPSTKLHVAGDIRVDGNIAAKYQDVAEWVPTTQKLVTGTVVRLDPHRSNQVLASNSSYDTSVAGVISAQPGIALGEAGEGKVLVATTGRVKVKVDATQGAIKVGDLLVTSDREGYAMKSEPVMVGNRKMHSPGTIVGKALEPLANGTGEILVLLSLQ